MSIDNNEQKEISLQKLSLTENNLPKIKKIHKKSFKKSRTKLSNKQNNIIPLLKPPNCRRNSKNGILKKEKNNNNNNNTVIGIKWDNKTIEEQFLDRKLHPRIKIDEPKTPYPEGDESDIYQEGINKLNEIKPTEELINNVVNSLLERNNEKLKESKTNEFKKRAYTNEYTNALKFYNENKEKFDELDGDRKLSLENTLINKFHKEVRSFSNEKYKY